MIFWQQFRSKLSWQASARIAPYVLGIIIVLLCWRVATIFWLFVQPPQLSVIPLHVDAGHTSANPLSAYALFKENNAALNTQTPNSSAPLLLQGVFVSTTHSAALIGVSNVVKRYGVGDELEQTGYRLYSVGWNHVVLQSAGDQLSRLELSRTAGAAVPVVAANQSVRPNGAPSSQFSSARVMGREQRRVALANEINQLQANPQSYLSRLGLNQTSNGVTVTSAVSKQLVQSGLRAGDVILSVNDIPVSVLSNNPSMVNQLKNERTFRISIQRGAQVITVQQSL